MPPNSDFRSKMWQVVFFPAGLYLCFRKLGDEHVFAILYGVLAAYFSGIMVRLMLTLTPIACVLGAYAVSTVLDVFLRSSPTTEAEERAAAKAGTKVRSARPTAALVPFPLHLSRTRARHPIQALPVDLRVVGIIPIVYLLVLFPLHCTMVTSTAYSSPSIVLASRRPDGSNVRVRAPAPRGGTTGRVVLCSRSCAWRPCPRRQMCACSTSSTTSVRRTFGCARTRPRMPRSCPGGTTATS